METTLEPYVVGEDTELIEWWWFARGSGVLSVCVPHMCEFFLDEEISRSNFEIFLFPKSGKSGRDGKDDQVMYAEVFN